MIGDEGDNEVKKDCDEEQGHEGVQEGDEDRDDDNEMRGVGDEEDGMRNDKDEKDDVRHDLEDGEKEMGDRRMTGGWGLCS